MRVAKRVKATINPDVLEWARTSASYGRAAAAEKLGIEEEALAAWEDGDDQPSISQLRRLATLYRRPLAVLYLPVRPLTFQPMHDFRRLPESGSRPYSPELAYEIRLAQQRRELALELADEDSDEDFPAFTLKTTLDAVAEDVGRQIRESLSVTFDIQSKWRDTGAAFIAWRTRIEELGVLVFQTTRVESSEASGFAFWAPTLPLIAVNRKDAMGRRLFSLLHELAHLMIHQTGVSELDDGRRQISDQRVEVFCNKVAAAALMPKLQFLSQPIIGNAPSGRREWSDEDIAALAKTFSVSRESVVRRLLTLERTTDAFYRQKRAQYLQEYAAIQARKRQQEKKKPIRRNMPLETVSSVGRPLIRLLLSQYHSRRLSLSEVSGFLGVKVRHLPRIEDRLAR
jgi:Zn-dependent peptidase ImmA (M78 family)/DNA-binding XRE family transcriptional regulator